MADREIREIDGEPDLNLEDPDLTPQNRWRWVFPVGLLVALPALGFYALGETDGKAFWPSHNALIRNSEPATEIPVGTAGGRAPTFPLTQDPDASAIRDIETLTGLNDQGPLVGRRVTLHLRGPRANDNAFWIGSGDNRVLVVPRRDRRDGAQRQQGSVADHGVGAPEPDRVVTITGSVQRLPRAEERYSWSLTDQEQREVSRMGVYIYADGVTSE